MSNSNHRHDVPAVKRPEAAEVRRLRAAELLAQGRSQAEVAELVGVSRESVRRWQLRLRQGGVAALRRRPASGRPPKLSAAQVAQVEQALLAGAQANGFATDLWTLDRVAQVIRRVTGVRLAPTSVWRLLHQRLGWSGQRPERQARERDQQAIARWVAQEWPRIKKGPPSSALASVLRRVGRLAAPRDAPDLVAQRSDPDPAPSLQLAAGLDGGRAGLSRQRPRARPAAVLSPAAGQL
jgi:transposase